jgi:uncharacterized membrane protein required for colicin V production
VNLDLKLLGVVAAFGALGAVSGAIKQAAQLAALAAAYLLAGPVSSALAPVLASRLPAALVPTAARTAALSLVYMLGAGLLRAVAHRAVPTLENGKADRLGGAGLGAAKGALRVFVGLCAVVSFEEPMNKAGLDASQRLSGSRLAELARRHNLFDAVKLPELEAAKKLAEARSDPKALQALLGDPKIQELLANPAFKSDPRVKKLLDDPALAKKLEELERQAAAR